MNRERRYYYLFKLAASSKAASENRSFFEEMFPNENINKLYAIADQYFNKFRNTDDFQNNLGDVASLSDVITLLRSQVSLTPKQQKLKELGSVTSPEIIESLSSSNVNSMNYNWILNILNNEEQDSINEIINAVITYQKNSNILELPLESFSLLSELRSYFDKMLASNKEFYLKKIAPHALDPKYTDYIYNSDNFITVLSGTIQSSQYWASGTVWCTSFLENNMFGDYSAENIYLYYIITKPDSPRYKHNDSMRKICIGYVKEDGTIKLLTNENATVDVDNLEISLSQIQDYLGEESGAILQNIQSDLETRKNTKFNEIISNITLDDYQKQLRLIDDESQINQFKRTLAENPNTSVEILSFLAKSEDRDIREQVAGNLNTPAEILSFLAKDEDRDITYFVAVNRNIPMEALLFLAKSEDSAVRGGIAANPNTPAEILSFLSKDVEPTVRWSVTRNPNIPMEVLLFLAKDKEEYVRKTIADNPNTPAEALSFLAKDEDIHVRGRVAENLNTPAEVLSFLAKDEKYSVRWLLAENLNTPAEVLLFLAKDEDIAVKGRVVGNPNTPAKALSFLAKDEDSYIRKLVARNPNTLWEALLSLAKDKNSDIRRLVARNPNTLWEALSFLAKDEEYPVRYEVAGNPNTPEEALSFLAKDKNSDIRKLVAKNPNTPAEAFPELTAMHTMTKLKVLSAWMHRNGFQKESKQIIMMNQVLK